MRHQLGEYDRDLAKLPVFDDATLQKLCQVLADSLTGGEITPLLAKLNAPDPGAGITNVASNPPSPR